MADKGYTMLNDKASHINPMRSFIWTIDFDGDSDSRVHKEIFSDGKHVDMYSQKATIPSKTMKTTKVNIMGGERVHPTKFEFEHDFSIDFLEDEQTNIKARFERWLLAFQPIQEDLDGNGQRFHATGDKFNDDGTYDLATNFILTMYKYGSDNAIEGDAIVRFKINGVFPTKVSEPEPDRNDVENVVITKVDFTSDWTTLLFNHLDEKMSKKILGI